MDKDLIFRFLPNKVSIREYGFDALKKALKINPEQIINMIIDSGLKGRGGAGFPTGLKWKYSAESISQKKYLICNADEGEPGTFKDRYVMEGLSFQLLEGIIIASYAIGADTAYIYIRGEYEKSIKELSKRIKELYSSGLLGKNILKSKFNLDVHIRRGAGSYLCGEELTLIESLEGKRGNPRIKPPFPAQSGLFGLPTLVNNVETLANVPYILNRGVDFFKAIGTVKSPGSKLFCVSGDVKKPGVYEAPFGLRLKTLIEDYAGGIKSGSDLKCVLLGGAAGTFVSASEIDVVIDYGVLRENGFTLGSGAVIVFDLSKDLNKVIYSILKFFHHESCGKCVPCRVGTKQLMLDFKLFKDSEIKDKKLLEKIVADSVLISQTSLCPLGQSPVMALKSAFNMLVVDNGL
jgi:NADP-reducing hydrogenase subunit HndC